MLFSPYASVDMNQMAAAFNLSTPELEKKLVELIGSNKMQARIDSHNKVRLLI
jgi:hypothetical protein